LCAIFKKYQGQNGIKGNALIKIQSESEARRLQDYFGNRLEQRLKLGMELKVPLKYFAEELTLGYQLTIPGLYEVLCKTPLLTKIEKKQLKEEAWSSLFTQVALNLRDEHGFDLDMLEEKIYQWFERLRAGNASGYKVLQYAMTNEDTADEALRDCMLALWYLFIDKEKMLEAVGVSIEKVRIPMFATYVMKNSHGFDYNQITGRLLWYALYDIEQQMRINSSISSNDSLIIPAFMQRRQVYRNFGLLDDDISSYFHIFAHSFIMSSSSTIVTLREVEVKEPFPFYSDVFALENPSVFSYLIDEIIRNMELRGHSLEQLPQSFPAIVCTSGRARSAALLFISRCAKMNPQCRVFYSGDLDLQGIQMWYHMREQFPGNIVGWRMDSQTYKNKVSDGERPELSQQDIKILEEIADELTQTMAKQGVKVYQEELGKEYRGDLLSMVKEALWC
jgi:uncharacterized protein (TIGR02679 family)